MLIRTVDCNSYTVTRTMVLFWCCKKRTTELLKLHRTRACTKYAWILCKTPCLFLVFPRKKVSGQENLLIEPTPKRCLYLKIWDVHVFVRVVFSVHISYEQEEDRNKGSHTLSVQVRASAPPSFTHTLSPSLFIPLPDLRLFSCAHNLSDRLFSSLRLFLFVFLCLFLFRERVLSESDG